MKNQAEIKNCPTCGNFFNYTGIRDVCVACAQVEEKKYEEVYRFLRKRENRAATVDRIVEETGVDEELLYKWVRRGRLQPALFPNLGYPCERCGGITQSGNICESCTTELQRDLKEFDAVEEFREAVNRPEEKTYYTKRD